MERRLGLGRVCHDCADRAIRSDRSAGIGDDLGTSFAVSGWLDFEFHLRGLIWLSAPA
jgi:hypothetical protein